MQLLSHAQTTYLITHYGSIAIFGLLAFGIFGLPIPDETLLVFAGFLIAEGKVSLITMVIAAMAGSMFGITVSYILGYTLGHKAIVRYGRYVGMTEAKVQKTHDWFEHFGKWLLIVGYFIPGIRHFTGLVAGTARLEYYLFALFAYTGAAIWSLLFLFIGFYFHGEWQHWGF